MLTLNQKYTSLYLKKIEVNIDRGFSFKEN